MLKKLRWIVLSLVLLGLLAYFALPWIVNPGTALTLTPYDLAEWATLYPPVAGIADPMLTAFFLRMVPVFLIWMLVALSVTLRVSFQSSWTWLGLFIVVLAAIALLPPLEFFTSERGNPNFRQQMLIAVITGLGGVVLIAPLPRRWYLILLVLLAGASGILATLGLLQARDLMIGFQMPVAIGLGYGLLIGVLLAAVIMLSVIAASRLKPVFGRLA
ncbi:MAG: hypothetical protein ACOCX5_04190 [Chloroflexota bacterium]